MSRLSKLISSFHQLSEFILSYPEELSNIVRIAEQHNGWFDEVSQKRALNHVATEYLNEQKLTEFIENYEISDQYSDQTVAIIMAGNIPLVGFHDLVCVLIAGHKATIKLSGKDEKLPKALILKLIQIQPELKERIKIEENKLEHFDAVIATGSNNSSRYFEEYFGKYPNIIRKNRNSVAILNGEESTDELVDLGKDIFYYYGLGCRNISKIFIPVDFNFDDFLEVMNKYSYVIQNSKYRNNFDYNLTLLILNKIPYHSNDSLVVTEDESLHSRIGMLHYQYYNDIDEVNNWILEHRNELQVIIGKNYTNFGTSQAPFLNDFADNIDTMEFLLNFH